MTETSINMTSPPWHAVFLFEKSLFEIAENLY